MNSLLVAWGLGFLRTYGARDIRLRHTDFNATTIMKDVMRVESWAK